MLLSGGTNLQRATVGYIPGVGLPLLLRYGLGGAPAVSVTPYAAQQAAYNPTGSRALYHGHAMVGSNPFYFHSRLAPARYHARPGGQRIVSLKGGEMEPMEPYRQML